MGFTKSQGVYRDNVLFGIYYPFLLTHNEDDVINVQNNKWKKNYSVINFFQMKLAIHKETLVFIFVSFIPYRAKSKWE